MHFFPALPTALADLPQTKVDAATRHCHSSGNSKSSPLPNFTTFGSLTDPSSSSLTATCLWLQSQLLPLCSLNPTKCTITTLKKPESSLGNQSDCLSPPHYPLTFESQHEPPASFYLSFTLAFHKHQDEALPASHSSLTPCPANLICISNTHQNSLLSTSN